jgi:demethylspheroidene O-methyltransferase
VSEVALDRAGKSDRKTLRARFLGLLGSPAFLHWARRFPLTRPLAERDGAALMRRMGGFVDSQMLMALVELRVLHRLQDGPVPLDQLATACDLTADRARILLDAGVGMGLLRRRGDHYGLARQGAALLAVPGLEEMILHHRILYADLRDPVAFLRGKSDPDLARFWPYVFGDDSDPETATRYSELMAKSQEMVAAETLDHVPLTGRVLDIGGGSGAFLIEAARRDTALEGTVFDLPQVERTARSRIASHHMSDRIRFVPGSFRGTALPAGHDTITLIRICYDHQDDTVGDLLGKILAALPAGGRLVISEPMLSDRAAVGPSDTYYSVYTAAMGTGRARRPADLRRLLDRAGFVDIRHIRGPWPFITSVMTARRPTL